ncbi:glycosyltransferase family 4 protein [uncultured Ruegeria sp.]|uniref:glycosyltransferase family 4 protein n=1 Tax=uncultured Ruegeria sp. TaxID=259304 RepID=UPI0026262DAB|nr:glycosyltransferase family 4 protein [uncultured Ruegeria sp.]
MSGIHGKSPKTVFCLTYHEITADARVLKEARAVRSAGHNVHIFCDWPGGLPQKDNIDGMQVTRFNWQSSERITETMLERFFFIDRVSSEVRLRIKPYIEAATQLNALKSKFRTFLSDEELQILDPMYYKDCSGRERRTRKSKHKRLLWKTRIKCGFGERRQELKSFMCKAREVREGFHNLYQLESLIFAENLCGLGFDDTPDIIHVHDIYCLPAGVVLAKQFQAKLIYDAHEYEPARATKNPTKGTSFAEKLEDDCLPFVDQMITVSPSIAEYYSRRFKNRPTLIFNVPEIDPEFLCDLDEQVVDSLCIRVNSGIAKDKPLIVFTGGVQSAHRGLDKVLEALVMLPDVYLVALGPRHKRDDKWLLDIAQDLGVADRVKLLPPVSAADVPVAIKSADVAICPIQDASLSYRFSMPNKLFEAAFAGLPICVSDLPDMRDFVDKLGLGRSMDQTDPQSIAMALRDVLEQPERFKLATDMAERLWAEYSWAAQTNKLKTLYEGI